jgi:hypothetical protein
MPRLLACLLLILLSADLRAQKYVEKELHFRYSQLLVSGNVFDGGFGVGGTVRRWEWDRLGWGISLGLDNMDFASGGEVVSGVSGGLRADGTAGYIPLQGSLLYRLVDGERLRLNAEGGLRFMVGLTSADVVVSAGGGEANRPIDVADSITGIAALHLEYRRDPGASLLVLSGGVQQDVVQGEYSVSQVSLGKVELSGAFVSLGMAFDL